MKRVKYVVIGVLAMVLIVSLGWLISDAKEKSAMKSQPDIFLFQNQGELHWMELTIQKEKLKGKLHQQFIIEEPGQDPVLEEKTYSLKGEKSGNNYELILNKDGDKTIYQATLREGNLFIQLQGDSDGKLYKAADKEELQVTINELQDEFDSLIYHAEYKEKERIRKFFNDLKSIYGFLYTDEEQSFQLFIKIDEALLEGEVSGSLVMMTNKNNAYEETTYALNGITDGLMIEFHTTVDGKAMKLEGNFHQEDASSFDLSFWESEDNVLFQAVTEDEFNQRNEEYRKGES
ncbi:hypothetical protein [Paucisalibacillus globulus]|uniref:hypothetical protein n=1 Tax=Paucisalibacillus globulus TaxID=351095 RepID=UPI00041494B2|nr:hypothetical protein [Paucisalibacillus globulus]